MATEVKMPQLSDTMESGKILSWRKKVGDKVARSEILAEVETEKANLEIECFAPGILLKILTPAGVAAKVGEAIAIIGQLGEAVDSSQQAIAPSAPISENAGGSTEPQKNGSQSDPLSLLSNEKDALLEGAVEKVLAKTSSAALGAPPLGVPPLGVQLAGERLRVSPLARKVADDLGVNLTLLHGSGPSGRIVKKDVELAAAESAPGKNTAHQSASNTRGVAPVTENPSSGKAEAKRPASPALSGKATLTPLTKMRETIARRMQESMRDIPHFYTSTTIDMEQVKSLRELLKVEEDYKGISYNHLVIKAVAYALQREPAVNCAYREGQLYNPGAINVGVITAVEGGLLIPVLHEADKMSLKDIVFETKAAIERARAGRPSSADLSGGTFSISNMGMNPDVEQFTAIISPGQGAVLAVGAVHESACVRKGAVVSGFIMKVTLSVDHRIIDGMMAASFIRHLRRALENPALLAS